MRSVSIAGLAGLALAAVWPTVGHAETIDVQPVVLCPPTDALCGFTSLEALRKTIRGGLAEVNLEYSAVPLAFHPLEAWVIVDPDLSALTSTTGDGANGMANTDIADLIGTTIKTPGAIALYLIPGLAPSFSGVPCPNGSEKEATREATRNGVFANLNGGGRLWAHELGHYWCLPHTFTQKDEPEFLPCSGVCGKNEVDDDPDSHACKQLPPVTDTDADPGTLKKWKPNQSETNQKKFDTFESDGTIKEEHRWCMVGTPQKADPGSPHWSFCGPADCMQLHNGLFIGIAESPQTEVAMSYYDSAHCRGPYVVNTHRTEAITPSQGERVEACRALVDQRTEEALPDRCKNRGDVDNDGWCDDEDNCPTKANTTQADFDKDGLGQACDGCDTIPGDGGGDVDGDHVGDQCDMDIDGDGCFNCDPTTDSFCKEEGDYLGGHYGDQHPFDANIDSGDVVMPLCSPSTGDTYVWEGEDTDGDGLLDCEDKDDDKDGVDDVADPCPTVPGTNPLSCTTFDAGCGLLEVWAARCKLGDCNLLEIAVISSNPDPTLEVSFPAFRIEDGALYLAPLANRTLGESAEALRGAMALPGGRLPEGPFALVLRSTRDHRVVETLAKYEVDGVRLGATVYGQALAVRLDGGRLAVEGTWGLGVEAGARLRDEDGDGVPDPADNCRAGWNDDQADVDADGFGDACDADVDGDRFVDERDEELVFACLGADLAEGDLDCDEDAAERVEGDRSGRIERGDTRRAGLLERCGASDLDGDGVVSERDLKAVALGFGAPIGPSARAAVGVASCDFTVVPPRCGPGEAPRR